MTPPGDLQLGEVGPFEEVGRARLWREASEPIGAYGQLAPWCDLILAAEVDPREPWQLTRP